MVPTAGQADHIHRLPSHRIPPRLLNGRGLKVVEITVQFAAIVERGDSGMRIAVINPITRTPLSRFAIPTIADHDDVMIVTFATYLASRGHEVDVYIAADYRPLREGPSPSRVRIVYLPTALKWLCFPSTIPFMPTLRRHLRSTRYDVIVSSETFQPSTILAAIANRPSRPHVELLVWYELARYQRFLFTIPARVFYKFVLRRILDRRIDAYVPRGELARQFLLHQGIPPSKVLEPITHGVDSAVYFPPAVRTKEPLLFSPSRLVGAKGIDVLLRAFAIVHEQRGDLRLLIQGDGPLLDDSRHLAVVLGISHVVLFGTERLSQDQMRQTYSKALVTLFASRNDNKLFAAMESIACGTPVIISTGADTHAEFSDRRGGAVFPSGDYRALASAILLLVNDDAALRLAEHQAIEKATTFHNQHLYSQFVDLIEERGVRANRGTSE